MKKKKKSFSITEINLKTPKIIHNVNNKLGKLFLI